MEIASLVLSKLGFDWQVALANLVNFLIVYLLLKKVVFNKLRDAILERKAKAEEGVRLREEAKLIHKEAEDIKDKMKKDVADERRNMIAEIKNERTILRKKTDQEVAQLKKQAHDSGIKEKERIISEVEGDIFLMTKDFTRKILENYQESPDTKKIELLAKKAISQ